MVNFGDKLKKLRIEKKLTQKQVSERVGLAISAISSYESGSRYPSYDVLIKYARMFHVSTDYLLGLEKHQTLDVSDLADDEVQAVSQVIDVIRQNKSK